VPDGTQLFIAGCWVVWAAYWLITGFGTKRTVERGGLLGYRLVTIVLFLCALAVGRLLGATPRSQLWRAPLALEVVGAALVAAGAAFAIWARVTLGRNWSVEVTFKEDHELVESGPYALVRHPIYTGLLTMALGTVLVLGRMIAVALFVGLCGGLWWKARQEEQLMRKHFPSAYSGYSERVRAIIPFVL
jgi:protein-S-isoprenylcysteine O-methyltransferase Ste14